jgi:glucose/arabinose dehydrogenase
MNAKRATLLCGGCAALVIGATVEAATPLTTERVAEGLNRPVFVTAPPGDTSRVFILEKSGIIKILDLGGGGVLATPFLNIDALVGGGTTDNTERGLLGLAFHPHCAANRWFYVNYTDNTGTTVVARYTVSDDPNVAVADSAMVVLTIAQPQSNHNGGWLGFGPADGYLYVATGDGGGSGDTGTGHTDGVGNAQDITDNLLGKMLRIDVDGDDFPADPNRNYAVPAGNPFVGATGDDEIWSFGLRNPWRPSFDRVTRDLYIADVGQASWEEISFQPADSGGGENYGWRCREGAHDFNTSGDCSQTPFTEPIYEYARGAVPFRCAITGGYVYRGCAIPDLRGTYFFADYCSGQIWSFRYDGGPVAFADDRTAELAPGGGLAINSITSFGEDGRGELYVVKQGSGTNAGEVYRIIAAGPVMPPTPHDYDNNGLVELFDLRAFAACMRGPGTAYGDCLCDVFDGGGGDVDLRAFRELQIAFGG